MKNIIRFFLINFLWFHYVQTVMSEESWVINDIRISGLQRVSAGSIFNVMPIAVKDRVDVYDLQTTAKTIFQTDNLMIFNLAGKEIPNY